MDKVICILHAVMPLLVGALGGGLFAFIQFLIVRNDEKKEKTINPKDFNQLIRLSVAEAQDRLVGLGESYLERGWMTVKEWAIYDAMYKPYRALGGNHYAEKIYEQLENLPRKVD